MYKEGEEANCLYVIWEGEFNLLCKFTKKIKNTMTLQSRGILLGKESLYPKEKRFYKYSLVGKSSFNMVIKIPISYFLHYFNEVSELILSKPDHITEISDKNRTNIKKSEKRYAILYNENKSDKIRKNLHEYIREQEEINYFKVNKIRKDNLVNQQLNDFSDKVFDMTITKNKNYYASKLRDKIREITRSNFSNEESILFEHYYNNDKSQRLNDTDYIKHLFSKSLIIRKYDLDKQYNRMLKEIENETNPEFRIYNNLNNLYKTHKENEKKVRIKGDASNNISTNSIVNENDLFNNRNKSSASVLSLRKLNSSNNNKTNDLNNQKIKTQSLMKLEMNRKKSSFAVKLNKTIKNKEDKKDNEHIGDNEEENCTINSYNYNEINGKHSCNTEDNKNQSSMIAETHFFLTNLNGFNINTKKICLNKPNNNNDIDCYNNDYTFIKEDFHKRNYKTFYDPKIPRLELNKIPANKKNLYSYAINNNNNNNDRNIVFNKSKFISNSDKENNISPSATMSFYNDSDIPDTISNKDNKEIFIKDKKQQTYTKLNNNIIVKNLKNSSKHLDIDIKNNTITDEGHVKVRKNNFKIIDEVILSPKNKYSNKDNNKAIFNLLNINSSNRLNQNTMISTGNKIRTKGINKDVNIKDASSNRTNRNKSTIDVSSSVRFCLDRWNVKMKVNSYYGEGNNNAKGNSSRLLSGFDTGKMTLPLINKIII